MLPVKISLALLIGYLIGAIPFGVIVSKLYKLDIRTVGSGNIGATNVYRNLGAFAGILVFILDTAKGAVPFYIVSGFLPQEFALKYWILILIGAMAIIGHMYPIYLKFKGGKGGATSMGVLIGLMPKVAAIAALAFILALIITRYVSISTMFSAISAEAGMFLTNQPDEYTKIGLLLVLFIIYKHRSNVTRIFLKIEPKVGENK